MPGARVEPSCTWSLTNVLVAGRRFDGTAHGRTPEEAVRHFAAVKARELRADVAAAIAGAVRDRLRKVEPKGGAS